MKHDAWRQDPAQYTHTETIVPRYSDVDTLRHLNNSALHGIHQEARMRFLAAQLGDAFWRARGPRLLAARAVTDFLLEAQYPEPLQAGVRLTALDEHQATLATALFQGGRCVGLQSTQLRASERGEAMALPAAWRDALAATVASPLPGSEPPTAAPLVPALEQFPVQRELDARYADLDGTGRASELALMRCSEHGRSGMVRQAFSRLPDPALAQSLGMLVARVDLHVLHHAPAPPRWRLGSGLTHIGRTSLVPRVGLFDAEGRCRAYTDCVLVLMDRRAGRPAEVPERMRELLAPQRLQPAPTAA